MATALSAASKKEGWTISKGQNSRSFSDVSHRSLQNDKNGMRNGNEDQSSRPFSAIDANRSRENISSTVDLDAHNGRPLSTQSQRRNQSYAASNSEDPAKRTRYIVRFPGQKDFIEVSSWNQVEDAIRKRGFDPEKARIHNHGPSSRIGTAGKIAASRSVDGIKVFNPMLSTESSPGHEQQENNMLGKTIVRTDYLLRDKTWAPDNVKQRSDLRMETSYDMMSKELWSMTKRGENPFEGTRDRRQTVLRSPVDHLHYYGWVNGCPIPVLKGAPRITRSPGLRPRG